MRLTPRRRLAALLAVSAFAALLAAAGPPPAYGGHTPAQEGKTWQAGTTGTPTAQRWTHTNYWTCNAISCKHTEITPTSGPNQNTKGGAAPRNAGGVSSCTAQTALGGADCGHRAGTSGWSYNAGSHTDTPQERTMNCTLASGGTLTLTVTGANTAAWQAVAVLAAAAHCGEWVVSCTTADSPTAAHRHASGGHSGCETHTAPSGQDPCPTPRPVTGVHSWTWTPPGGGHAGVSFSRSDCAPLALDIVCPDGWHKHAAGVGHGQDCRGAHSVPSCTRDASGAWRPSHAVGQAGHMAVTGMTVCPQTLSSFCADVGATVFDDTRGRQYYGGYSTEAAQTGLLPDGYHADRIPWGWAARHDQFVPSLSIKRVQSPSETTLAPGVWADAWALTPRAPSSKWLRAEAWDWDSSRWRSCGSIRWRRAGVVWQSSDNRLVLDAANRRMRWTGSACPADSAEVTVTAQWSLTFNHRLDEYDTTDTAASSRSWTVRCGATAAVRTVCDTHTNLPGAAFGRFASYLRPRVYTAQHWRPGNRWNGAVPFKVYERPDRTVVRNRDGGSWRAAPSAAVTIPAGSAVRPVNTGHPPLVLLYVPLMVMPDTNSISRSWTSWDGPIYYRMQTAGWLGPVFASRADGSAMSCGNAVFRLEHLSVEAAPGPGASLTATVVTSTVNSVGYRRFGAEIGPLPLRCGYRGEDWDWGGQAARTEFADDCAGEAFYAIDLDDDPCKNGALTADIAVKATWGVSVSGQTGTETLERSVPFKLADGYASADSCPPNPGS